MNIVRVNNDGTIRSGARGSYREGSEDFVTPYLFQTWALFGERTSWVSPMLCLLGIETRGKVSDFSWCYLFEQAHSGKQICIADIVFSWRDEAGDGVVVIEAKVRGGKLTSKDIHDPERYLRMPSIASIDRRSLAFLVDTKDCSRVRTQIQEKYAVVSWQDIIKSQCDAVLELELHPDISTEIRNAIIWNAKSIGIDIQNGDTFNFTYLKGVGSAEVYDRIESIQATRDVKSFLLGSEVRQCVARGFVPSPPYPWMAQEPDVLQACDPQSAIRQSTADRQVPRWRLGWKPRTS